MRNFYFTTGNKLHANGVYWLSKADCNIGSSLDWTLIAISMIEQLTNDHKERWIFVIADFQVSERVDEPFGWIDANSIPR